MTLLAACSHEPVRGGSYTVRNGDTVYSIAKRFGVDFHDLARWNRLDRDFSIHPGQTLIVRAPSGATKPGAASGRRPAVTPPAPALPQAPMPKWVWPVEGGVVTATERPNGAQGMTITGALGQSIRAASDGRVVYTGTGLLGYGQLVIVKHNESYLTAYGYTQSVLVKEGDQVAGGQSIATMGPSPQGAALLYFEIRLNGKPIEPLPLLPKR